MTCSTIPLNELLTRQQKLNDRVGIEWEQFMAEHGTNWDDMTEESKEAAIKLSVMQSARQAKQIDQYRGSK